MKNVQYEIFDLPEIQSLARKAYAQKKRTQLRICGGKPIAIFERSRISE